ncbi:hypothetical protein [Francisella sp. SYW-9]|uniref:hypothetical protein n=1 Tax=Francisella sp. SYW-9 TaxID=2610888 RepID=UPI00123DC64B|nr:hypothetical protein [Francisella sp. SYW-9]
MKIIPNPYTRICQIIFCFLIFPVSSFAIDYSSNPVPDLGFDPSTNGDALNSAGTLAMKAVFIVCIIVALALYISAAIVIRSILHDEDDPSKKGHHKLGKAISAISCVIIGSGLLILAITLAIKEIS